MLRIRATRWRLGAGTSPGGTKFQAQWMSISARRWASTSTSDTKPSDTSYRGVLFSRSFFQGTITTSSPSTTSLSDLLPHLNYYIPRWSHKRSKNFDHAFLLLLLTPSYARHALDPEFPLQAFQSMSGDATLEAPLRVITAVVDALPGPRFREDCGEGLAYLYRQLSQDEHDFSMQQAAEQDGKVGGVTSSRGAAAPGDLTFLFDGWATAFVPEELVPEPSINERTYAVTVPLAQTLFYTGHPTTMQLMHIAPASTTNPHIQLKGNEEIHSARLSLPFTLRKYSDDAGYQVSGRFPLTPLTSMRMVKSCLGNVVKTISTYPSFGPGRYKHSDLSKDAREAAIEPASQELEEAISAHFSKQNIAPSPVDVYALILPEQGSSFAIRDKTARYKAARMMLQFNRQTTRGLAPTTMDQAIRDLIVLGDARLCKVLSGGGGWGEKKGLLSLDPDSHGPVEESRGSKIMRFGKDHDGRFEWPQDELEIVMSEMRAVVKTGEHIMFFLAASDPSPATSAGVKGQRSASSVVTYANPRSRTDDHAVFGTVRTAMDALPQFGPAPSNVSQSSPNNKPATTTIPSEVIHVPHLFGALSASPLTLSTSTLESLTGHRGTKYKLNSDYVHATTKLGVAGLSLTVERRMFMNQSDFIIKQSQSSAEESKWYATVEEETIKRADLGVQREIREEAHQLNREARTTEEMTEFQGVSDRHKAQTENMARTEDLFARMSNADVDEDATPVNHRAANHEKQARPWGLPADEPAGGDTQPGPSALKKSRIDTGHQGPKQDRDGGK